MYIFDLMTNKMVAPVIDTPPYFSWKISSEHENVLQKSYRLRVFQRDRLMWDSGEVFSRRQSYIPYEGEALMPTTGYRWTVDVSCDHGESASAEMSDNADNVAGSDYPYTFGKNSQGSTSFYCEGDNYITLY